MKKFLAFAGTILVTVALAACSPGIHGRFGYGITFENGEVVAHAPDHPDAYIDADGNLRIGKQAVAVTPQQRVLLRGYYAQSKTMLDAGIATGKAGVKLGAHAVGNVISSIFSGKSKQSEHSFDAEATAIDASAKKICADANRLHDTQQAIAAQLPAFKPYQAFDNQIHCDMTMTGSSITVAQSSPGSDKPTDSGQKAATAH